MENFKLCVLCRHFEVLRKGREFPQIADSEYFIFRCNFYGITVREDYLMKPPQFNLEQESYRDCPSWEHWILPSKR